MQITCIDDILFISSDQKRVSGMTRNDIKIQYPAYRIVYEENDFFIISRNARMEVTLRWGIDKVETFDMRKDILNLYGRQRATPQLLDKFFEDWLVGKFVVYMDQHGYTIK